MEFNKARVWLYEKEFNTELWADSVQIVHQQRAPIILLPLPKILGRRVEMPGAPGPPSGA